MGRLIAGHQPHAFPGIEYLARMSSVDVWVFSDDVKFNRYKNWQNRNRIQTPTGEQFITVPIVAGSDSERILDKKISYSDTDWPGKIWKTIECSYSKTPFFKDIEWIHGLLLEKPVGLVDLIKPMITGLTDYLHIDVQCVWATEIDIPEYEDASEKLAAQAVKLECDTYVTGPQGWTYLNPEHFRSRKLQVKSFLWDCPEYPQRWKNNGFSKDLSILDVITNCGPDAAAVIRKGIKVGDGKWGSL